LDFKFFTGDFWTSITTLIFLFLSHWCATVVVLNIRNSAGTIGCALFESPVGFPFEFLLSATNIILLFLPPASLPMEKTWR